MKDSNNSHKANPVLMIYQCYHHVHWCNDSHIVWKSTHWRTHQDHWHSTKQCCAKVVQTSFGEAKTGRKWDNDVQRTYEGWRSHQNIPYAKPCSNNEQSLEKWYANNKTWVGRRNPTWEKKENCWKWYLLPPSCPTHFPLMEHGIYSAANHSKPIPVLKNVQGDHDQDNSRELYQIGFSKENFGHGNLSKRALHAQREHSAQLAWHVQTRYLVE